MMPRVHIKNSTLFAIGLLPILKKNALWFWIGGVMIDFDHYVWYVWQFRDLNPWHAYCWLRRARQLSGRHQDPRPVIVLHTAEVLLGLGLLAFRAPWSMALFAGMAFHLVLDLIEDIHRHKGLDREYLLAGIILDRWRNRHRKPPERPPA